MFACYSEMPKSWEIVLIIDIHAYIGVTDQLKTYHAY